jgi:hypothetical protein
MPVAETPQTVPRACKGENYIDNGVRCRANGEDKIDSITTCDAYIFTLFSGRSLKAIPYDLWAWRWCQYSELEIGFGIARQNILLEASLAPAPAQFER